MHISRLDHATINTADLDASIAWYERYLELKPGYRPDFGIGGAWLYPQDQSYPIVHLISRPDFKPRSGMFDHIAFRSKDLNGYLAKVKASGDWYTVTPVMGTNLVQVQHFDPNEVLIEVNFADEPLDPAELRPNDFGAFRATKT